mgnify:CR=1 FL=1
MNKMPIKLALAGVGGNSHQPGAASRRRVAGTHGAVARRGVTDTVCPAKQRCDRAEPLF